MKRDGKEEDGTTLIEHHFTTLVHALDAIGLLCDVRHFILRLSIFLALFKGLDICGGTTR